MLFNSAEFAIFLPIVLLVFFGLPHRFRWQWLLLSSCVFYMAYIPWFILVIGTTIVIDYFAGIFIAGQHGKMRKYGLIISLIANIGILFFFKYFNFFYDNLVPLLSSGGIHISKPNWNILLPIGLSFHTFQAMSYTIEVYRGHQAAERHFGIYALYVLFFPQMVAGPIERPQNMLHQFHEEKFFSETKLVSGLRLILWGLFKKLVIADRAAIVSDEVFAHPDQYGSIGIFWASVMFAFRIYGDFSGYTDIARGAARMLGFELMLNFRRPYLSASVTEFWRRWHISLSTWFKDYVYIPLGGNRALVSRVVFNLLITFIVSGLWHGADWKFVVWGGLNGAYIAAEYLWTKLNLPPMSGRAGTNFNRIKTFLLICFSWIFFAAPNMQLAIQAISQLGDISHRTTDISDVLLAKDSLMASVFIFFLLFCEILIETERLSGWFFSQARWFRWMSYATVCWIIFLFGQFGERQFIYFVF